MRIREIYELVIKKGLEKDPRTKKELKEQLRKTRREYAKLRGADEKYFDKTNLRHPYSDTRILYGDEQKSVRNIMVGIDIGGQELLTAYLLNEKGAGIDLALSHHPSGRALSDLARVMSMHVNILHKMGLREDIAKALEEKRAAEVARKMSPANNQRNVDIARLLDIPFMCVHTPADNQVAHYLAKFFEKKKPKRVKDVLALLKTIPEYRDAMSKSAGPHLIAGGEENVTGKIFVDMTGGTEGSRKIFSRLSQAGVNTVVGMHLSEEHFKTAKAEFMNVIIAGHIASDTLGLNLMLDAVEKKGKVNAIPCSGFVRIKR